MTDSAFLTAMPKVELHVHIEGALKPDDYFSLAHKNGARLPVATAEEWRDFYSFRDFNHFIEVYTTSAALLQSAADYHFIISRFFALQAAQNIRYSEAFMSATFMHNKDEADALYDAIEAALKAGRQQYGIEVRLIPDISREVPEKQQAVADFIIGGARRGIFIGAGLGGVEEKFPAGMFKDTFDRLRAEGLRIAVHAGESSGHQSVRGAVEVLKAERIGHGLRLMEDPQLIALFRETQLPVEVSPTSNYRLKVVASDRPHPIRQMLDAGVNCSVNSDDPGMFSTSLSAEYHLLHEQGFTRAELWQLNRRSLDSSFLSAEEKAAFAREFDAWFSDQNRNATASPGLT